MISTIVNMTNTDFQVVIRRNDQCGKQRGYKVRKVKDFWVSFIPKYVSNYIFLSIYYFTSLVPVPRKIRDQNYKSNIVQLRNMHWDVWTVRSAYIENQNEWSNIMFGAGKHHNMRRSGCEVIATFNVLKALTGTGSPESMAELIREYEVRGAALRGEFGVSPRAIEVYFREHGFRVATTDKTDDTSLNMVDRQCQVLIATVYNDGNDITKQVHTVCITKDSGQGYVLHNTYCKDKNGTYVASAPYATLTDAVNHISRYGAKLIYLIGIVGAICE